MLPKCEMRVLWNRLTGKATVDTVDAEDPSEPEQKALQDGPNAENNNNENNETKWYKKTIRIKLIYFVLLCSVCIILTVIMFSYPWHGETVLSSASNGTVANCESIHQGGGGGGNSDLTTTPLSPVTCPECPPSHISVIDAKDAGLDVS